MQRRSGPCRSITGGKRSTTSQFCGRNECRLWRELRNERASHFDRDGQGKRNGPLPQHPIPKKQNLVAYTKVWTHLKSPMLIRTAVLWALPLVAAPTVTPPAPLTPGTDELPTGPPAQPTAAMMIVPRTPVTAT